MIPETGCQLRGQMEAVDGREEEERTDTLVEVLRLATERVQLRAGGEEPFHGRGLCEGFQRLVAHVVVLRSDDGNEVHGRGRTVQRLARRSTMPVRTSSRSPPDRARASCAVSRPYLRPMS